MEKRQPEPTKEIDLSRVKYIISDWDGTLVDSREQYSDAFANVISQKFGIDFKDARKYYFGSFGKTLNEQVTEVVQKFTNQTVDDTAPIEMAFWDAQLEAGHSPRVLEGARQTLEFLRKNGYQVIIWSGSRTDFLGKKLQETGLNEYIDFYIGNQPGSETQVKGPGLLTEIARQLKISQDQLRSESVVIGDAASDIKAGRDCNISTIGVVETITAEDLKNFGADFIIEKIGDLPNLFK